MKSCAEKSSSRVGSTVKINVGSGRGVSGGGLERSGGKIKRNEKTAEK
jgi:hypothetical protein